MKAHVFMVPGIMNGRFLNPVDHPTASVVIMCVERKIHMRLDSHKCDDLRNYTPGSAAEAAEEYMVLGPCDNSCMAMRELPTEVVEGIQNIQGDPKFQCIAKIPSFTMKEITTHFGNQVDALLDARLKKFGVTDPRES